MGAALKRSKKLPICNYAPKARSTRITHLMGSLPSRFPPNGTQKAPRPPSGPFLFWGPKPPSLDSSMKRLFGVAIERL